MSTLPRKIARLALWAVLLASLPAAASAAVFTVEISNPTVYTAVFRVDTTAETVVWVSGADGPGSPAYWTPAGAQTLDFTGSAGVDLPDDPAALRDFFIDPDFTPGPSDQWFLSYGDTADGFLWNEGDLFFGGNHAGVEAGGSQLRIPTGSLSISGITYSRNTGPGVALDPGWSVTVAPAGPELPILDRVGQALLAALMVLGAIMALGRRRTRVDSTPR